MGNNPLFATGALWTTPHNSDLFVRMHGNTKMRLDHGINVELPASIETASLVPSTT